MDRWDRVVAAARRQLGLVTLAQLRGLGVGDAAARWAVRSGRLERVGRAVFRLPGVPASWRRRALEALLLAGPGARLSHASAAHLWRFDGFEHAPETIDVMLSRGCRVRLPAGARVHSEVHDGLPATVGPFVISARHQALLELAQDVDEEALEVALDSAHRAYPFVGDELERLAEGRDPRRVPGLTRLLGLVRERGGVATDSPLETRLRRRIRLAVGVPPPVLQHHARDERGVIMRVDFAWPAHRVAVHVDGFRWHSRRDTFDRDASQRNRMAAAGWEELVVTSAMDLDEWMECLRGLPRARAPQRELPFPAAGLP